MKRFLILSMTFIVVQAIGQDNIKEKLVGEWSTFLSVGDSGLFHFNSDGSMFISSPHGVMGKGEMKLDDGRTINSLMRYTLNTNVKPVQIDFYYAIDNYFNVVGKAEGIIELLDDNLLRLAMNYNRPKPIRPQNFDNPTEAGVLNRHGKSIEINNCQIFKKGNFEMHDAFIGTTRIVRDNNFQIETNDLGDKVKLKIEWVSECTYTLKPIEFYINNKWVSDTTGIVQTVQIIKATKDSYIYSTGNNKTKQRMTRELFVAKD